MLKSPWTHQINKKRNIYKLEYDIKTDILIIGGGISGVLTAYNLLKNTDLNLTIVDAHEIAHGATGHNAGQLVSNFERSITSLVSEYGLAVTMNTLAEINKTWQDIDNIIIENNLNLNYSTFIGYDLFKTIDQIIYKLKDIVLLDQGHQRYYKLYISESVKDIYKDILTEYEAYIEYIPHTSILSLGETKNTDFISALPLKKGCMNSALFTEELINKLIDKYDTRLQVYEYSEVKSINFENDKVQTLCNNFNIYSDKVILCTNGFENFNIISKYKDINFDFHKNIKGMIGYMKAFTTPIDSNPSALAYFDFDTSVKDGRDIVYDNDYIYTTKRHFDLEGELSKNLFCIGGLGLILEDTSVYNKTHIYKDDIKIAYDNFINKNLNIKQNTFEREYIWHGLMGYTSNGLRIVDFDKREKRLGYNLGCNGVGIMTSIYGSKRIVELLTNKEKNVNQSLFDIPF